MAEVTDSSATESRKVDHIRINLEKDVQFPRLSTGLEKYRFVHQAVPELNLDEIDTTVRLFGKSLNTPILISSMTGGTARARHINERLAKAAQKYRLAMGVGSQRAAIEDPALAATYQIRDFAPDALIFANLGAVQLNYGYGITECQRAVDMIKADALILHFNALQEAVQPEGNSNFAGLLAKVETICRMLEVPVIAKEVGWGFSEKNARDLSNAGVAAIDVAGSGGTSWSEVEYYRAPNEFHANVAAAFADWGIPTAEAILYAKNGAPGLDIIASGGIRDGIEVAKCIALGAKLAGLAGPFLKAADNSVNMIEQLIETIRAQLRIAMLCSGSHNLEKLRQTPLLKTQG